MTVEEFESHLSVIAARLAAMAASTGFESAKHFESAVRAEAQRALPYAEVTPPGNGQWFPDVAVGRFGIEVKFTEGSSWRCVANSVLESDRRPGVDIVYVLYAKMGAPAGVRWRRYENVVMHVRTSHVPRFEIDMEAERSLFDRVSVPYERFRTMEMHDKMVVIRKYAKEHARGSGRRLWWIEDEREEIHTLPPDVRLYTSLTTEQKLALRAEGAFVSPQVVSPSRERGKYDDVALYLMTYHGVLCTQVRDLFSAGSVAMRNDTRRGGLYINRALNDIEAQFLDAVNRVPDAILREYWGIDPPPKAERLRVWLKLADQFARDWRPSESLFQQHVRRHGG